MSTGAGRMEYIVDFNDSAMVAGIPRTHAAFKNLATQATTSHAAVGKSAQQSSDTVVSATNKATRAIEDHGKKTKSVLEMIEWRLKYTGISAVTYAGMAGIGAFTAALVAASSAGIQFNSMMEKSTIAYTTMLGSAGEASNMLGKLYDLAAKSPFTFEDFVTGTQRLIAYGVAAKDVLRTLNAIGDATAAVGGTTDVFTRMSFSIGQMVSQGKITAREMRELAMAGVPAWQVLADAIGKTVAETQKLSETTGIAAETGIPALLSGIEERFGGMQEKMNQTWTALGSTFKDYMSQMAGYAEGGFFETLKKQLNDINNWIGEINDRARQVGFMNALKEQSPGAYDALKVLEVNLRAVGDAFSFVGDVVKPFIQVIDPLFVQFAVGALVIPKIIPALTAMTRGLMGLTIVSRVKTLFQDFTAILHNVRVGAYSASGGMSLMANSTVRAFGALNLIGAVVAAAGVGYIAYKKHLDEVKAAQEKVIGGAKTLATSMGATWVEEIGEAAATASEKLASFQDQNAAIIAQLQSMNAGSARGLLLGYAIEMQTRGVEAHTIQRAIDQLVQTAGLTMRVPIGIDAEATGAMLASQASLLADELEQTAGPSLRQKITTFGLAYFDGIIEPGRGQLDQAAQIMVSEWARALDAQVAKGEWFNVLSTLSGVSGQPTVLRTLAEEFGQVAGIVDLATGEFEDFNDVLDIISKSGVSTGVQKMIETYQAAIEVFGDEKFALDLARDAYEKATRAIKEATQAQEDYSEAAKAATEVWQKELEAQYSIGDAINVALRERQEALNDAATAQNEANQRAAEAEKKTIDARANAEIKSIERVRDIRLASLKEQEELYQEQKSFAEGIGFVLGVQMAEDHIKALQNEQEAVKAAADAEKDAIKSRADAQKEAVEAFKVSAEQAELSINDISAALEDAIAKSDDYLANMAFLPERVQSAILESGLTPEQKQKLAEELVAGSKEDRDRAFRILQEMADRRSKEAAEEWGNYSATVSALSAEAGQKIVDALVEKLRDGGKAVFGAVGGYSEDVAKALNPILETLGAKQIQIVSVAASHQLLQYALGGFLPSQATIQRPVGPRGLVQWAEPSTKGEAFIPLAPEKRPRSIQIWEQTGRMLGAFAGGGFLSPWEGMESPTVGPNGLIPPTMLPVYGDKSISMPHSGNVSMQSLYDLASAWMKSPGAAGVVTPSATGFAGMVATAVAVWEAVKAYDAAVQFMGGRASRPYKSDHTTGHAFDFGGSSSQMAAAAAWLAMMNPNQDVKYIIHNPLGIWKPSTGWRPYTPAKSVLKYAGESAWHRDHVHVSTYDQGGLLMPGVTLAYNGTGRPERVISFADGGFSGFTGGTNTLTYSAAQETAGNEAMAEYRRAAAGARVYAAALEALEASGASATEQLTMLNEQVAALEAQRKATQTLLDLSDAAGASDEQLADLRVAVSELDTQISGLKDSAEALTRVPLEQAAEQWASRLGMLKSLFDMWTQSTEGVAEALALIPQMLAAAHSETQAYIDLMNQATDASERFGYAQSAIASIQNEFNIERQSIQTNLQLELDALDAQRNEMAKVLDQRSKAIEDASSRMSDAAGKQQERLREEHERALKELEDFYDAQLRAMDDYERELDRREVESEIQSLYNLAGKSASDLDQIQNLRKQLADMDRKAARQKVEDERDAAIESLRSQQEAEEKRLESQLKAQEDALAAQQEALDAARRAADVYYDEQRTILEQNAQEQVDLAVEKYAKEIEIIMAMATDVTASINEMTGVVIDSTLAKVDTTLSSGGGAGVPGEGVGGSGSAKGGTRYMGSMGSGGAHMYDYLATSEAPGAGYEWDPFLYEGGGGSRGAWKQVNYLSHAASEADAAYGLGGWEMVSPAHGIADPYDPGLGGAYFRQLTPEEIAARAQYQAEYMASPAYAENQRLAAQYLAYIRERSTYDDGGWLMPGVTLAVNNTGLPERVVPPGGFHDSLDVRFHITTDGPITDAQAERLADVLERKLTLRQGRNARNQRFIRGR